MINESRLFVDNKYPAHIQELFDQKKAEARAKVVDCVLTCSRKRNLKPQIVWWRLYSGFVEQTGIRIPKCKSKIDFVEEIGMMAELLQIAERL